MASELNVGSLVTTGNVGIGTTSPGAKLHVSGDNTHSTVTFDTGSNYAYKNQTLQVIGGSITGASTVNLGYNGNLDEFSFERVSNALNIKTDGAEIVTFKNTGLATFSAGITVSGGFLSLGTPTELTIVESNGIGAVTATRSFHDVDTEGDAGTDDLDTINGGSAGDILTLKILTSTRNVTVKDATGNLRLAGDFTLTSPNDIITLIKYSTVWIETSRSDNV